MGAFTSSTKEDVPAEEEVQVKGNFVKRYTIGKQLGKGSQGVVHVCYDRQTGTCRAVKILDRSNKTAWATYKREVELSQATSGRNIASILEEYVDQECCYSIMERFEGHLRRALKWVAKESGNEVQGLDGHSLAGVLRQALSAILHLHTCGVVHRDVKAHNLLVDRLDLRDPRCRIVLSDFGLARRLEPGRFLCAQVGTRKYWAPELYEKKYWHVVDVFALGVLMYLAACSVYPYQDEEQTRNRDVFALDLVPPEISADALVFMRKALTKDPNQRPSAAELGQHPWLQSAGGILQQTDDHSMRVSPVGRGPCAIAGSRRFGPKVSQAPVVVREPRGDIVQELEADCPEAAFYKEATCNEDTDMLSTTIQAANQSPRENAAPYKEGLPATGDLSTSPSLTKTFLSYKAPDRTRVELQGL